MIHADKYFNWTSECGRMVDEFLSGTSNIPARSIFDYIETCVRKFFTMEKAEIKRNLTDKYNLSYIDDCQGKMDFTSIDVEVPDTSYYLMTAADTEFYCMMMVNKAIKGLITDIDMDELRIKFEKCNELTTYRMKTESMYEVLNSLPKMDHAVEDADALHERLFLYINKLRTIKPEEGLVIAYHISVILTSYDDMMITSIKRAYMTMLSACRTH